MSRPTLEVADIIQAQGNRFLDGHRDQVSYQQLKVAREKELLGVPYFHLVFTLRYELIPLCQRKLSRVFRGKFVDGLKRAYRKKKIRFSRANSALEQPKHFLRFLRTLFQEDWVVYAKPAFGGGPQVLRYLGRYTHRVAISNHRLLAFDGRAGNVPLEGLCARQQTAQNDAYSDGVSAAVHPARTATWLRAHSSFRVSRQQLPDRSAEPQPAPARRHTEAARAVRPIGFPGAHLGLPALWCGHAHRPQSHRDAANLSVQLLRQLIGSLPSRATTCVRARLPWCVCLPGNTAQPDRLRLSGSPASTRPPPSARPQPPSASSPRPSVKRGRSKTH
jgi:hypothetical protein